MRGRRPTRDLFGRRDLSLQIDGHNAEEAGSLFDENSTYAVDDFGTFQGREAFPGVASSDGNIAVIAAGCGHLSNLPYVVIPANRLSQPATSWLCM